MPTPAGVRKRTAAQDAEAEAEISSCKRHKVGTRYARRQQLQLRDIVQDMQDNSGDEFLKDVDPAQREAGWDINKEININAIERNQGGFFKKFELFLGSLKHHKRRNDDGTMKACSHEKLKRHGTAVNNLWRKKHRPIPFMFQSLLKELLGNKKKKEKKQKADGEFEGEDPHARNAMTFELYRALCWYFLVIGNVFSHPFLIFCWNMMVRNCNCDELNFPHIKWKQDALTTLVENTKTNKDGRRDAEQLVDKHLYANIYMPEMCPILGLGFYLIVHPQVGTRQLKKLFPGKDTHVKFNKDIQDALADPDFARYLKQRGISHDNIGGYSTRKGASTYCTSGTTAGPSVVAVCTRANWSMGPTLERYLKNGQAGDQFCGRVVCGLPQLDWRFSALPPHFNASRFAEGDGEGDSQWEQISTALDIAFPYADRWGKQFAPVCMFMLASLVHHYDWVCDKLPVNHPVRQTRIFQGDVLPRLKPLLATGDQVTLRPTGIPPWVICFMMLNELKDIAIGIRSDVQKLPAMMNRSVREALNERDEQNGTASYHVVRDLMSTMLQQNNRTIEAMLDARLRGLGAPVMEPTEENNTLSSTRQRPTYGVWMWAHEPGTTNSAKYSEPRYRYLPKDFLLCYDLNDKRRKVALPVNPLITRKIVTVFDAWNLWFFGLQWGEKLIRPLRKLTADPKFHFFDNNARKRYSDVKALVLGMLRLLEEDAPSPADTDRQIQEAFPKAFDLMEKYIQVHHPNERRRNKVYKETCKCCTMKKHYYEAKKNASSTT